MGRAAIFVDAGYIRGRAQTKRALANVSPTRAIILDEQVLIDALRRFAELKCHGELLRIYWYDGMPKNGMTAEHLRLATIDDVKLRFGTLNDFGNQKGVDSRIIADMIELARNRAIDSAVLVGGDDDLRVGIEVAQSYGVRFHLLGMQDRITGNQSKLLQQEADSVTVWDRAETDAFIGFAPGEETKCETIPRFSVDPIVQQVEKGAAEASDDFNVRGSGTMSASIIYLLQPQ